MKRLTVYCGSMFGLMGADARGAKGSGGLMLEDLGK